MNLNLNTTLPYIFLVAIEKIEKAISEVKDGA